MDYELFTYPNCPRCDALKSSLAQTDWEGSTYDLTRREGKLRIREYLKILKRDDKGAIILPTLIVKQGEAAAAVINNREELADWLRSKA